MKILLSILIVLICSSLVLSLPNDADNQINFKSNINYSTINVNNSLYWQGHTGTDGSWLTGISTYNSTYDSKVSSPFINDSTTIYQADTSQRVLLGRDESGVTTYDDGFSALQIQNKFSRTILNYYNPYDFMGTIYDVVTGFQTSTGTYSAALAVSNPLGLSVAADFSDGPNELRVGTGSYVIQTFGLSALGRTIIDPSYSWTDDGTSALQVNGKSQVSASISSGSQFKVMESSDNSVVAIQKVAGGYGGFSIGSYWDGSSWIATDTLATLFYQNPDSNTFQIYIDTGLTPASAYSPTTRMSVDANGYLGVSGGITDGVASTTLSIDPNNRFLYASDGVTLTEDWNSRTLYDSSSSITVDWENKNLNLGASVILDWSNINTTKINNNLNVTGNVSTNLIDTSAGSVSSPAIRMGDTDSGFIGGNNAITGIIGGTSQMGLSYNQITLAAADIKLAFSTAEDTIGINGLNGIHIGMGRNVSTNITTMYHNVNMNKNLNVTGTIITANASSYTNLVVCYLAGGKLGHCTSIVGIDGSCTCVVN